MCLLYSICIGCIDLTGNNSFIVICFLHPCSYYTAIHTELWRNCMHPTRCWIPHLINCSVSLEKTRDTLGRIVKKGIVHYREDLDLQNLMDYIQKEVLWSIPLWPYLLCDLTVIITADLLSMPHLWTMKSHIITVTTGICWLCLLSSPPWMARFNMQSLYFEAQTMWSIFPLAKVSSVLLLGVFFPT